MIKKHSVKKFTRILNEGDKSNIVTSLVLVGMMSGVAMAASQVLNGGGATWYGGEDADDILFSKLWDNAADGIKYDVIVWCTDDKGGTSQKSGTTSGVGAAGEVKVIRASTHANPFVAEKCGYKNFVARTAN